jgi:ubiquitin-conjugating enzyme E2 C
MIITEDYPYEKPIIKWQTEIFHPNIMLPDDGGYVCTRLLDDWSFSSNLLSFIKGVESLLVNPNPGNPYGSDSCTRAAEYFNTHEYSPPVMVKRKNLPRIVK